MDIDTDDDILRKVAKDGSMDYSCWPALLQGIVSRIAKIAHSEFPIPRIPPPQPPVRPPSPRFLAPLPSSDPIEPQDSSDTALSSQETDKENANPSSTPTAPPNPAVSSQPSSVPVLPPLQPPIEIGTLPAPIAALLDEVTTALTTNFPQYPPHTIQRLAEIVLYPKQHYLSLTAYLHALDRVVRVTSGANIYPLPPAVPDMNAMSLLANGVSPGGQASPAANPAAAYNVGSDEALGGALLTPIPWLTRRTNGDEDGSGSESEGSSPAAGQDQSDQGPHQQQRSGRSPQPGSGGRSMEGQVRTESTETIEGPNGMGSIETVSISVNGIPSTGAGGGGGGSVLVSRGVTQGELLRQEQRAGVVPVSQLARQVIPSAGPGAQPGSGSDSSTANDASGDASSTDNTVTPDTLTGDDAPMTDEHEVPHARGPEEIGAADMGPQQETTSTGSYVVGSGSGSTVEMHGIDVERAVGRPRSDQSATPATEGGEQKQADDSSEVTVPRSPKREADVDMDGGPSKKLKEGADGSSLSPVKDAEGDVVITDPAQESTTEVATSDGGEDSKEDTPAEGAKEEVKG